MAYTTDDLFGDNLLGDPNDLDNLVEFRDDNNSDGEVAGDRNRGEEADDKDDEDQEDNKDTEKKPEQKTVRIKRPQPKLDAERLKGPRGLKELRKSMSDVKFRGKGHEAEDLQRIMARVEHWSHRLFPKFQFDDFIEKVEKLGSKKVVQNYIKRMRMGLLDDDDDENHPPNSDEEAVDNPDPVADETMNEFDRLLAEQVSLHQNNSVSMNSPRTPGAGTPRTPAFSRPGQASTPVPSLTAEQRARMEANRLAALEKRRLRMEAAAAAAATATETTASTIEQSTNSASSTEQSEVSEVKSPSHEISADAAARARMEANRLAALERRRIRMEAAAAAATAEHTEQSTTSTSTAEQSEESTSATSTAEQSSTTASPTATSPFKEISTDSAPGQGLGNEAPGNPADSTEGSIDCSEKNNESGNSP